MLMRLPHDSAAATVPRLRSRHALVQALALLLLVWPLGRAAGQGGSQTPSPTQVLEDLLDRYGENSTISVPQLRSLLAVLSQGQREGDSNGSNMAETSTTASPPKSNRSKCLPADTLAIYSMSEQSRLDGRGLQELCPTMLQQLDAGTCRAQKPDNQSDDASPRPSDAEGESNSGLTHFLTY